MSPQEVDNCSLWKFGATVDGYNQAHMSEEERRALSDAEVDDLSKWLDNVDVH